MMKETGNIHTISKSELLENIDNLQGLFREYRTLIGQDLNSDSLDAESERIITSHLAQVQNLASPITKLSAIEVLLRYLLSKIKQEKLTFHLPTRTLNIPEEENRDLMRISSNFRNLNEPLRG